MDESAIEINRDDLLKLGGTSALAALLAVFGAAEPAEARNKHPCNNKTATPIVIDFTTTVAATPSESKTDPVPIKRVNVSKKGDIQFTPPPNVTYRIALPAFTYVDADGTIITSPKLPHDLYFYIWTK